jgi:hypothetical protein
MRGDNKDTIWLLLGVLLLFGTMAAFSPGSTLGRAFISLRGSLEDAFGGGVGYCPFINPYAMSIYSAGELVISSGHPLCDPVEYALDDIGSYSFDANNEECDGGNVYALSLLTDSGQVSVSWGTNSETVSSDVFFNSLSTYQQDQPGFDNSNKIAIQLLTEKRPAWQCFFIFGLLPFFITYYLLNDILTFAYLRTNTRRLIAIFAALLAVLTGGFANIIVAVSSFVGLSVGQSFLLAIFALAMLSVFLGQLTVTAGVAQTTVNAVQKAVTGALILTNLSEAAGGQQDQEQ